MKQLRSSFIALVVGCVLWWLWVYFDGFLAAQSWPPFVVSLSKGGPQQAIYLWQVVMYFAPTLLMACLASYALFRFVGASTPVLFAAATPYAFLNWVMGSFERVPFLSPLSSSTLLSLVALSAFPLGLFLAWLLAHRGYLTPSIEQTASSRLRRLNAAAHVER